jgi:RNA polymerase sigma factor (TIGR02999 family)
MPLGASTGEPAPDDVSALLRAWTGGDQRALAKLTPIVYDELHRLAHHYLKGERAGHSLQTTALVNEAYVRLVDYKRMHWQNRAHFIAVSAQAMRRILAWSTARAAATPNAAPAPSMSRSRIKPSFAPIAPRISSRWTTP